MTHSTLPAFVAFQKAETLAQRAAIKAALHAVANSFEEDHEDALAQVRRVLLDAQRAAGIGSDLDMTDPNGEQLCHRLFPREGTDYANYWHQVSLREEAGYIFGLAVGLLLGRGEKGGTK